MSVKADCSYSLWLERELRSDHAGETGAVWIYRGVIAARPELILRQFCLRHLETEKRHLEKMNMLLEPKSRSALLPLWRAAGFLTGFFVWLSWSTSRLPDDSSCRDLCSGALPATN